MNQLFSLNVVLEASTGNVKFNEGPAAANLLGKFDIGSQKVVVEPITSINDKIIKDYASKISPYIAFKKGGGDSPAYSTMRIGLKENYGIDTFRDMVINELTTIDGFSELLTEEFLEEGAFDMIKRAGNWAKNVGRETWNKFQKVIKKVLDGVKKVLSKIVKMGKRMFEAVMAFFGLEINNVSGVPVDISL